MAGCEAFDRLTCMLVNEADFLKEVTEVFALYMSVEEWLMRQLDVHPIDGLFTPYCAQDSRLFMAFEIHGL
jgi:hypothetical protein